MIKFCRKCEQRCEQGSGKRESLCIACFAQLPTVIRQSTEQQIIEKIQTRILDKKLTMAEIGLIFGQIVNQYNFVKGWSYLKPRPDVRLGGWYTLLTWEKGSGQSQEGIYYRITLATCREALRLVLGWDQHMLVFFYSRNQELLKLEKAPL